MARDRQEQQEPPAPRQPRYRFRTELIAIPLGIVLVLVAVHVLGEACSWDGIMDFLHVHDRARYSALGLLGAGLLGLLMIVKVLTSERK
jgi:hypothetical protein